MAACRGEWRESGGEPNVGLMLPRWLEDAGFRIMHLQALVEIVDSAHPKWEWLHAFVDSGSRRLESLGDMSADANTLLLLNFNEPAGSTMVQDSGPLGRVGTLGVGFPGATPPQLGPVVPNEPGSGTPASMVLHAPTPNPVADVATLRYELAAPVTLRLAVYDALGREVGQG